MRQKRAKTYRKLMELYSRSFGFRQPYQTLVDSEICSAATHAKIDLTKQLGVVLQGTVKPMITQCCIHELYLQGPKAQPTVDLAKTFERRRCNHREPIGGEACLVSVVGDTNKHRYAVASQSADLRARLRAVPGVPLVHVNRAVMVLEPPSEATLSHKSAAEEGQLHASAPEAAQLAPAPGSEPPPKKKRKGPKGPNPLSVKKKKAPPPPPQSKTQRPEENAQGKTKRVTVNAGGNAEESGIGRGKRKRGHESGESERAEHALDTEGEEQKEGGRRKRKRRRGAHEHPHA